MNVRFFIKKRNFFLRRVTMEKTKQFLDDLKEKTLQKFNSQQDDDQQASKGVRLTALDREYKNLQQIGPKPDNDSQRMKWKHLCQIGRKNMSKNRKSELIPFDSNLYQFADRKDRYINASWIDLDGNGSKYIIAMAPLAYGNPQNDEKVEGTINDFWQMCWETKCRSIVMLCDIQQGISGCAQYFPATPGTSAKYGHLTVKHRTSVVINDDSIERIFCIQNGSSEEHRVHHFHYTAWPNYGVPESTSMADFVTFLYKRSSDFTAPSTREPRLIIHCYAGIGRSGTFLTIFHAYCQLLQQCNDLPRGDDSNNDNIDNNNNNNNNIISNNNKDNNNNNKNTDNNNNMEDSGLFSIGVCLEEVVGKLRRQRHPWMVEGVHQYRAAYRVLTKLIMNQALRTMGKE